MSQTTDIATVLPLGLDLLAIQQEALGKSKNRPASLPAPNPTRSFWLDSPNANPLAREGSDGNLTSDADVCIIGSGITGVSAAYHLARGIYAKSDHTSTAPFTAVILEAREFCSGATGRNGGHMMPYPFFGFREAVARHGTEQALRGLATEQHTVMELQKLLETEKLANSVDFASEGRISLHFSEKDVKDAEDDFSAAKDAGVDLIGVEWFDKAYMQEHYGTSYAAIKSPAHNLWPLKLVTHLYMLTKAATPSFDLYLHTRTPVTSIHRHSVLDPDSNIKCRRWLVTTPRGTISCRYVIHATNAYASYLLPHLAGSKGIIPVRGQVMALRAGVTLDNLSQVSWDANKRFEYWFPRPVTHPAVDRPLVIIGGGREVTQPQFEIDVDDDSVVNPAVGKALRAFLPFVLPGKFENGKEPEMEWTGIMGFTKLGYPLVGPVPDASQGCTTHEGQFIAAGYNGHGMTRAFACAEIVSSMIVADYTGHAWVQPGWFPDHYLTQKILREYK